MKRPSDGLVRLKSLARCFGDDADYDVKAVSALGTGPVPFERDETSMTINIGIGQDDGYPVGFEIQID
jgi:hypothetical protein